MSTTAEASFYVTGGTLRQDSPSYVERQADRDLYAGLTRGEFCYVLTSRQMGKSSLMVHTAARLRQAGVAVAVLDLTAIGQNLSAEQWYGGLLRRLGRQLDPEGDLEESLEEFWFEREARVGPLERWMAALQQIILPRMAGRIVIFIDEIDAVRSLAFSTDEFFAGIRECYNRRTQDPVFERLTFCLLGVATPSDLIQDVRTTPFNIGQRVDLTDFTTAEAAPLAAGLSPTPPHHPLRGYPPPLQGEGGLTFPTAPEPRERTLAPPSLAGKGAGGLGRAESLLRRILFWTGGHPYLTQRLCQAVAGDESATDAAAVDRHCGALFLSAEARERDDNLLFVRERLLKSEADLASLLDLYGKVRAGQRVGLDDTNPLLDLLRLSGITRVVGGQLRVRNRIYERVFDGNWVTTHMPDAELRRQRAAYRRGLLRATTIAAVVFAVTASLAGLAVQQAQHAHANAARARRSAARANLQAERASRGEQAARAATAQAAANGRRAEQEKEDALQARSQAARLADQRRAALAEALAQRNRATAESGRARAAETRARGEAARSRRLLYIADMNLAQQDWETGNVGRLRQLLRETRQSPGRGFEWDYWQRLCHLDRMTLRGHTAAIDAVAFSPDGRRIITGSGDFTARVWAGGAEGALWGPGPGATGRPLLTLGGEGEMDAGYAIACSPDGRWVATSSGDHAVRVWDISTGRVRKSFLPRQGASEYEGGPESDIVFSPSGQEILTASQDHTVRVLAGGPQWGTRSPGGSGRLILTLSDAVTRVTFSPDGRHMACADRDGLIQLRSAATGSEERTLEGRLGNVTAVAFSPDGRRVAASSEDGTVQIWDAATGQQTLRLARYVENTGGDAAGRVLTAKGHAGPVVSLAFSPDSRRIVTGGYDNIAIVWDAGTGRVLSTLKGHEGAVWSVAFSPDGQRIVTASEDGTAKVWDADLQREIPSLLRIGSSDRCLCVSSDGRQILVGAGRNTAELWDAGRPDQRARKRVTLIGHRGPIECASFSPDGKRIVTGSDDATARVWDAATGREIHRLSGKNQSGRSPAAIDAVAFSPDGRRIVTGSGDSTAREWDSATGRAILTFRGHRTGVRCIASFPGGQRVATADWGVHGDSTLRVWEAAAGRERLVIDARQPISSLAVSPDGRLLLTGSEDGTVTVWNAQTGRKTLTLTGHAKPVIAVAFTPDAQRIMSGSLDDAVRIWDPASGRELLTLHGDTGILHHAAFSPSGRRVTADIGNGIMETWEAASPRQVAAWAAADQAAEAQMAAARARAEQELRRRTAQAAVRNAADSSRAGRVVSGNLLVNGSFEEGPDPGSYRLYRPDSTDLPGWRVTRGTIEVVGSYWTASHGRRSVDMDGISFGGIAQTFATLPGRRYRVSFDLAANPDVSPPTIKKLRVSAAGQSADFAFDRTGRTAASMGWVSKAWEFTARSPTTTLEFDSLDAENGRCGPALDNVAVVLLAGADLSRRR